MTGRRVAVAALGLLTALALALGIFWYFIWAPRTAYSCDGLPTGAQSPREAGERFVQAVVDNDAAALCAVVVDKLSEQELTDLSRRVSTELGGPTAAGQVNIHVGEQGGSSYPLTLDGPAGEVGLSVYSFRGWYRVDV